MLYSGGHVTTFAVNAALVASQWQHCTLNVFLEFFNTEPETKQVFEQKVSFFKPSVWPEHQPDQKSNLPPSSFSGALSTRYNRGREPIHYRGPHELYIIAGEPQNQFIYPKILPLSDYKAERLLLTYYLSTYLSWSFVLTLYLVL